LNQRQLAWRCFKPTAVVVFVCTQLQQLKHREYNYIKLKHCSLALVIAVGIFREIRVHVLPCGDPPGASLSPYLLLPLPPPAAVAVPAVAVGVRTSASGA
jgi:hypothetical protein